MKLRTLKSKLQVAPSVLAHLKPAPTRRQSDVDAGRGSAGQHSNLYSHRRWRRIRADQLRREPLCRFCDSNGRVTEATVCDHIDPHRGDLAKFWAGPFQSLCKHCHDGEKQRLEKAGLA